MGNCKGLRFGIYGLGLVGLRDLGMRLRDSGFKMESLGLKVQGFRIFLAFHKTGSLSELGRMYRYTGTYTA